MELSPVTPEELPWTDESTPPGSSNHVSGEQPSDWKPQKNEYMVMYSISIISLMVALDATILVPVLPVRMQKISHRAQPIC
jgi:hypothetical protein